MALITTVDRNKLYTHIKHELGYPLRPFELTDEMMDSYLEMVVEDYSSYVNEWLIQQQWVALQGLEIDTGDFFNAFTTKSNNFMKSFTFAYSKQVGLGTNAPAGSTWELKRDFITTSASTQHYIIPAGREVNEVLWETPPPIDQGMVDPFALSNWSAGQFGWGYMGRPAMYVQPTYSTLLSAQDRHLKHRILQSELTYRITGMADGTKILHLYPIPGNRNEIRSKWGKHYAGRKVWYFYYDVGASGDTCIAENKDVVRMPSDVPLESLEWSNLNSVARQQVRDLLIAKTKMVLGGVRGFYSGEIGSTDKELTMDYRHMLEEGENLKTQTKELIYKTLDKLSLRQATEDRAAIAEAINKERGYQPPQFPIMTI
jgi:hypothetical protein